MSMLVNHILTHRSSGKVNNGQKWFLSLQAMHVHIYTMHMTVIFLNFNFLGVFHLKFKGVYGCLFSY